jgi:transposase InsO family protein
LSASPGRGGIVADWLPGLLQGSAGEVGTEEAGLDDRDRDAERTNLLRGATAEPSSCAESCPARSSSTPTGTQYTCEGIAQACSDVPVLGSMGRTRVCWDNAAAESF